MHITKNNTVKNVTKGVYNAHFKDMGWIPYNAHVNIQGSNTHTEFLTHEDTPDYTEDEDLNFDTMSHKELLAFAKRHDISLGRVRQKDEIIDLLKQEYE